MSGEDQKYTRSPLARVAKKALEYVELGINLGKLPALQSIRVDAEGETFKVRIRVGDGCCHDREAVVDVDLRTPQAEDDSYRQLLQYIKWLERP